MVIAWFVSMNHGDVFFLFFFWVIRATSFQVGFLPFCVSTSTYQEETVEKILHDVDIVKVLLVGWVFLPFQSGILPGSCRNDCVHTVTPTQVDRSYWRLVKYWRHTDDCCLKFLFWRSPSILRQRNRNRKSHEITSSGSESKLFKDPRRTFRMSNMAKQLAKTR